MKKFLFILLAALTVLGALPATVQASERSESSSDRVSCDHHRGYHRSRHRRHFRQRHARRVVRAGHWSYRRGHRVWIARRVIIVYR